MPTPTRTASPFESLEKLTKKAAQPVGQLARDLAGDVAESFGQQIPDSQKQQISQVGKAKVAQIRQNIALINQQMAEARKKREQKWQEQNKQKPPFVPQQRDFGGARKESVLARLIKSRQGTKEGMQRASG